LATTAPDLHADLSKSHRKTLDTLYAHPVAHNLDWHAVLSLFARIGEVEHRANDETIVRLGAEHQLVRRPHNKDLTLDEVMLLRHFLTRAGWSLNTPIPPADTADLLVAIDHHEARIYHLDLRPADPANHVIKPHDPHHVLHHLTHKVQTRPAGERAAEDPGFYENVALAVASAVPHGRIVVIGHGHGHSDAGHHFVEWLKHHHDETHRRLLPERTADLSSTTPPQLLALAREALA
jgi:hypothetical protein